MKNECAFGDKYFLPKKGKFLHIWMKNSIFLYPVENLDFFSYIYRKHVHEFICTSTIL